MIDSANVLILAGNGGDGIVSFRREKYVPKGGPDGGDGGDGGDVYLKVDPQLTELSQYNRQKRFNAQNGQPGLGKKKHGKDGKDLILYVPIGTQVLEKKDKYFEKIIDLTNKEDQVMIAKGGKGGLGNVHFKSSTNQTPQSATRGKKGQEKNIYLNLKLIADVGLIGLPNAGKSSLLVKLTSSKAKIGDYPFTTTNPNLGTINAENRKVIIADIPGLIKGASTGRGLGLKFLKHIERTNLLIHLVSSESEDMEKNYLEIRNELKIFNPKLLRKKEIVVISKKDLQRGDNPKLNKFIKKYSAQNISIYDDNLIRELSEKIVKIVNT